MPRRTGHWSWGGHVHPLAGKLVLAGPFENDSAGWRGLFVFAVDDVGEATRLVATDPVIVKDEMVAEYHPWHALGGHDDPELHDKLVPGSP